MPAKRRLTALRHTAVGVPAGTCYGQTDVPLASTYPDDLIRVRDRLALRHTAVGVAAGTCYGQIDVPLASTYRDEPAPQPRCRIISSPLQRCHRLATDLVPYPVETDARLMELSFGEWEGLLWSEIPRAASEHWTGDVVHRAPPGGESFSQLILRLQAFLDDAKTWSAGPELLVVTHAGVIRALHRILTGTDMESCLHLPIHFGEYRIWEF